MLRFGDLQARQDVAAFNTEAFDAVFSDGPIDRFMAAALRDPWHYGPGIDFVEYYSDQLSCAPSNEEEKTTQKTKHSGFAEMPAKPASWSEASALMISYEVSPLALLVVLTVAVLVVATALCAATIVATGNGKFAVGLGIAVATIAVAYASFASDVYSLVG